uniref:Ubiquitin-like protease family profile domain-containing protein n=1 Tax=Vitis vinifera TaxID=29760 RepID=A5C2Y0_VITVI|nr:hypothetical protein VITISV_033085 [Vitis vinifera]
MDQRGILQSLAQTQSTTLNINQCVRHRPEASLPSQVTVEEAREYDGPGGSGNQALKPSSMRRCKRIGKRIVKCLPTCKSLFVAHYVKKFPKIPHADRVVADYALTEIGDPSNLKADATNQVIMDRCCMYLDADILGRNLRTYDMMFIPICENNHWHILINFPVGRVEILSSLPLRRENNISASTRRLSVAIHKALHAYRIHMDLDVSTFVHV